LKILVFARAPVPGKAKTRLEPRLGAWGAARLQARLTRQALCTALAARCGPVELHGSHRHTLLLEYATQLGVTFRVQRGSDLGERMHHALSGARGAILIGTDCPELRPADLQRAARLLRGPAEVVIAPARDGGYVLIGARRVSPELFAGIEWGGPRVYDETLRRLALLRYRWRALREMRDIDRPADLAEVKWLRSCAAAPRCARRCAGSRPHSDGSGRT
jgi:rSAM/selenodomain-associated transferase 1